MLNRARLEKTRNCMYDSIEQAFSISLQQLEGQESGPWKPKAKVGMARQVTSKGQEESRRQSEVCGHGKSSNATTQAV